MARKAILVVLLLVLAPIAAWWIDSAVTCDAQDQYTLRGVCLMRTKALAESGDTLAQWVYGLRLQEDEPAVAREWFTKAARQARTGVEVSHMHGLCGAVFDKDYVESRLLQVAGTSPDAHLLLLSLYLDQHCGKFDFGKATAQIPRLSQCASLNLKKFLDTAEHMRQVVPFEIAQAIKTNIERCRQDIRQPPSDWNRTASELLLPDASELATLEARLGPLLGPAAPRTP
jgi:hypothetical protein